MPMLKAGTIFPTEAEDEEINAAIAADPDTYEPTDEEFSRLRPVGRPKAEITKERISIRLSPEVMSYFRDTGKGWQTRIDQALKDYVLAHKS
ncbi:MAG TPA: hypothetical protein DE045_02375 [Oceanospirillaceae bacterium]|nr:hypothetical protein [Oceanospirillaceae bacterium]